LSLFADSSNAAIFNFRNPDTGFETLAKIKAPAFAVMGCKDDALVISIEETFEKLTKALVSSPKVETKILGDANHGFIGDEQALADSVASWLLDVKSNLA
jgi:dienelactone hydrolase